MIRVANLAEYPCLCRTPLLPRQAIHIASRLLRQCSLLMRVMWPARGAPLGGATDACLNVTWHHQLIPQPAHPGVPHVLCPCPPAVPHAVSAQAVMRAAPVLLIDISLAIGQRRRCHRARDVEPPATRRADGQAAKLRRIGEV